MPWSVDPFALIRNPLRGGGLWNDVHAAAHLREQSLPADERDSAKESLPIESAVAELAERVSASAGAL